MIRGLLSVFVFLYSFSLFAYQCEYFFKQPVPKNYVLSNTLKSVNELRIVSYNFLNLYIHMGDHAKGNRIQTSRKPEWALREIAELFERNPFDILIGQEIESIGSAYRFNRDYLNNEFIVISSQTRDVRGLHTIFFIRKTLPFKYNLDSHLEEKWIDPMDHQSKDVFSRDLPTIHITDPNNRNQILMTLIGVHFKSQRHRSVTLDSGETLIDVESKNLRQAQANRATEIIQKYQLKYGYNHPILIAGDFNDSHNFAPEFSGFLRHAKLIDTLSLNPDLKYQDKISHSYFGAGIAHHQQLDGILIVPSLEKSVLHSEVLRYVDSAGNQKELPKNKYQRMKNPSDHWPVFTVLDFQKILELCDGCVFE